MAIITRTRETQGSPYYRNNRGSISTGLGSVTLRETVQSDDSKGHHHYFSVVRQRAQSNGGMFYTGGTKANPVVLDNVEPTYYAAWSPFHLNVDDSPSDTTAATKLLSSTSPNQPEIDLPAFVGELRDLPQLFRVAGNTLLEKYASLNLLYQFGWKPLVSDLFKLYSFQKAFQKKAREINDLYDGNGLFRKQVIFKGSAARSLLRVQTNTNLIITDHQETCTTTEVVWGYVRWKPTTRAPETDDQMAALVRKVALGLYVNPHAAWQLMPWSWLIDWCTNAGDFISLTRNAVPCVPTTVRICRHKQTNLLATCTRKPGTATVLPVNRMYESKSRSLPAVGLNARMPFLSGRQASILASIGLLRAAGAGGPLR